MPTDLQLNSLLDSLLRRLARSGPRIVVCIDELPEAGAEALAVLESAGLIEPAEPAGSTICQGCGRGCLMPVEILTHAGERVPRARIVCDKPEANGSIRVPLESLKRWAFAETAVAHLLARHLRTDRTPTSGPDGTWRLGAVGTAAGNYLEIVFASNEANTVDPSAALVVLAEAGDGQKTTQGIPVSRVLTFRNGQLVARRQSLAPQRAKPAGDGQVILEISYDTGEVELVDRVADVRVTLAKPRLGSASEVLFEFLRRHPGRVWDRQALTAANVPVPPGFPHKFLDNLGFVGDLRRAFFNASQLSIRMTPTLTQRQLDALKVSPGSLLAAAKASRQRRRRRNG